MGTRKDCNRLGKPCNAAGEIQGHAAGESNDDKVSPIMNPQKQLIHRMENFLRCQIAENHGNGIADSLYERPSITISRQAGTRSTAVGSLLMDYLDQFDESAEHGWALFDKSLLTRVIEDHPLPVASQSRPITRLAEREAHEIVTSMIGTPATEWTLFQHSADTIRRLSRLGNVIILGRGANYLTQDLPHVFHVRLVGDTAQRTRAIAAEHDLDTEKADEYREALDQARSRYVKQHLERNIDDSAAYHMIINVSRLDPQCSARLIGDAVIEWAEGRALPMSA